MVAVPEQVDLAAVFNPDELEDFFTYLDALRESGVTNMFGGVPYLINEFGLDEPAARAVLIRWMATFDTRRAAR